jgi:hypothetical protein
MQRPTILASMAALAGGAFFSLCILHDVRMAGGYNFLARTMEAKVLSRIIGACSVLAAYIALVTSFRHPQVLPGVLLFESLVLAIHVPIVFSSNGPGWLFVGALVVTAAGFVLASGKRVQEDLRRLGPDVALNQKHPPSK